MRAAILEDGKVVNVIEVESLDVLPDVALIEAQEAAIGDEWDGEVFSRPEPYPVPVTVPQQVTMRQARLALLGAGLLSQVEAAIEALPSPQKEAARIEWDYSSVVQRNQPFVLLLSAELGLDDAGLDQLFITAAGL